MNTNELLAAGAAAAGHGQRVPFGLILLALVVLGSLGYGVVRLTNRRRRSRPPRPVTKPEPPIPAPQPPGSGPEPPGLRPQPPSPGPAPARPTSFAHPGNGWAVETHGLTKRFGDHRRGRRRRVARPARLRLRLPRPERRGQDHPDPHLARLDQSQRRHDVAARHPGPGRAEQGPGPGRGDRRRAPLPPAPDRPGQPPPAGRGAGRRRGPADRAVAGPGRPGRPRRGQGGHVLDGHAPAPGRGRLPARRPGTAHAGRADERARPGGHARDAGDDLQPGRRGPHRRAVVAPAG